MKIAVRAGMLAVVVGAALAAVRPVQAQGTGDGFLFQRPSASFSLYGGLAMPNAGGDLFSYSTSNYSLSSGDFRAIDYGAELAFTLTPRLDLAFDVSTSGMSKGSDYRNWVDNSGLPIEQRTSFQRTPLTVNVRYYLTARGRQIGRYAWVPARIVPYVGAGAGAMYYSFNQSGDFIDFSDSSVFHDALRTNGWAPMGQLLAGVEWGIGRGWALKTEARYLLASASSSGDFSGYRVDLSGLTSSVGIIVRF